MHDRNANLFLEIETLFDELDRIDLPEAQKAILIRLKLNNRLRDVFDQLLKKRRPSGDFYYPSLENIFHGTLSDYERQMSSVRRLFHFVFCAVRDEISAARIDDIESTKADYLHHAAYLELFAREIERIAVNGQLTVNNYPGGKATALGDVGALRRVSSLYVGAADSLRSFGDPLTVARHRGDPVVRGLQTAIASKCMELFGQRMDGIAAALASVALDKPVSRRISRSALSGA